MRTMKAALLSLALGLGVVGAGGLFVACSSSDTPAPSTAQHASNVIGKNGGSVFTPSGAGVVIPAGALATDTTITVDGTPSASAPSAGHAVGTAYTFGPEGEQFALPVTVTVDLDPTLLPPGKTARDVYVYTAPSGSSAYQALETTLVDADHVSAKTTHFSVFVSFVPLEPPVNIGPPDASADTGSDATAGPDTSTGSDATAGPDTSTGDAGVDTSTGVDSSAGPDTSTGDAGGPDTSAGGDATLSDGSAGPDAANDDAGTGDGGAIDAGTDAIVCIPLTCTDLGATCGAAADGCGNVLDCGPCVMPQTCGGGGVPLQCGLPSVDGGASDGGPSDAGAIDAGLGPDAAVTCSTETLPFGICSDPPQPVCSSFPGTTPTQCTDNDGGPGYTATCCPP